MAITHMKMNTCKTKPENKKTSRLDLLLKEKYKTIHVYTYIAVCYTDIFNFFSETSFIFIVSIVHYF